MIAAAVSVTVVIWEAAAVVAMYKLEHHPVLFNNRPLADVG